MSAATDPSTLMTEVARLFFDRQRSKTEIAAALGISRFRVARLLAQSLEDGVVRIEYRDAPQADRAIAAAIEDAFGLSVCVVSSSSDTADLGRLAASLIDSMVGPEEVVGIAWGSTLAAVVAAMPVRRAEAIEVVQLAGSSVRFGRGEDPVELARLLADCWGATAHPLFAPAFVDRPSLRTALLAQPEAAATVAMFPRLTLAVVGIGAIGPEVPDGSSLVRSGALAPDIVEDLIARGVVGDLLLHPVTEDGRFPADDLARRAVAIGVDGLRHVPRVVAVAGGAHKAAAIRGALRTGIVGVLVTDVAAGRAILEPAA